MTHDTERHSRTMPAVNALGVWTLMRIVARRFVDGWQYAILAPVLTTLLFFAVFALALGDQRAPVMGLPFFHFLAPGLVAMTAMSTAFEAAGWATIDAKISGTMEVFLAAPLRPTELAAGLLAPAVGLGLVNGALVVACMQPFVPLLPHDPLSALAFLAGGSTITAGVGLFAGLWANKYDHVATVQNFVVAPLVFLSGAFFPVAAYGWGLDRIMQWNPVFWAIDGMRRGFVSVGEGPAALEAPLLALIVVALLFLARGWFAAGWRIKS